MKKWLSLVLLVFMGLSLIGCGKEEPPTLPENGFVCQTSVQYKEMLVEGRLTCAGDGTLSLECTLPKSLYGVTFGWDGTGMTMGLGKMQMEIPTESVPQSALIGCLARVLTTEHKGGTLTEDGYVFSGQVGDADYTLVCDPDTGLPVSLTVPGEELTANFTETTPLTEETE